MSRTKSPSATRPAREPGRVGVESTTAWPPDRRTRKRQRRREAVYQAATTLFVERGYDLTTMDDIADRADVARATVFNHFKRKSAFVDEWAKRRRDKAVEAVHADHLEDRTVREILRRYMIELAKVSTESRLETVALMNAAVHSTSILSHPALAAELSRYLVHAQTAGELPHDALPDVAGLVLASSYFAILTQWIGEEPPFDLRERLLAMLELILTGLESPHRG